MIYFVEIEAPFETCNLHENREFMVKINENSQIYLRNDEAIGEAVKTGLEHITHVFMKWDIGRYISIVRELFKGKKQIVGVKRNGGVDNKFISLPFLTLFELRVPISGQQVTSSQLITYF